MSNKLWDAVVTLSHVTKSFSDADLGQPWAWGPHKEGVRFALIGTYHELRDLAVRLAAQRRREGPPLTAVHHLLHQYHAAFRDLQSLLLGLPEEIFEQAPAPGEWPLRRTLAHMFNAERHFFALVHYALRRCRAPEALDPAFPAGEVERLTGADADFETVFEKAPIPKLRAQFAALHRRVLDEFADVTDAELEAISLWWEEIEYDLHHRLHRFDAHLRQHTVQVEKTLVQVERVPTEAGRLQRLVYQAMAEVEGICIGAPELGTAARLEAAARIAARAEAVKERVSQAQSLVAAVAAGDLDTVNQLLAETPALALASNQEEISVILVACYNRQFETAQALRRVRKTLRVHEAAALGDLLEVQAWVEYSRRYLDQVAGDGFTPLQLACFFGQSKTALWLIEQGANVTAVAQNGTQIQPIHAAANFGDVEVVRALLARGADANARQANDYTPLHGAADNGNAPLVALLLEHGAVAQAQSGDGKTALDLARARGHDEVIALLQEE